MIWVFGIAAPVLIAALAFVVRLAIRQRRARRALERSFQREWFGLARWAPLASGQEASEATEPGRPEVADIEQDERPPAVVHRRGVDPAPAVQEQLVEQRPFEEALVEEQPWPPESHDQWVAILAEAQAEYEREEAEGGVREEQAGPAQKQAGPADTGEAEAETTPEQASHDGPPAGPDHSSQAAGLASLAANLAPVPEYAPLAAELASLAAELASLANHCEAGDTHRTT